MCRAVKYQLENCICELLVTQFTVCRAKTFLNRAGQLFVKIKEIYLNEQNNVLLQKTD